MTVKFVAERLKIAPLDHMRIAGVVAAFGYARNGKAQQEGLTPCGQ